MHIAEIVAGVLLIMRMLFSPDWLGIMNLLTLGTGIALLYGRVEGRVFPTLLAGSLILIVIDVFMGLFAEFMKGSDAVLLIIRTLMFLAFLVAFIVRYLRERMSEKLLIRIALACTATDVLLSIAGGCLDMMTLGQTALVTGLVVLSHIKDPSESDMGSLLIKTGSILAVFCLITAIWGIAVGTGAKAELSSYYKLFLESTGATRGYDLYYIGPNVNWNIYGGILGAGIGLYMLLFGRKFKNA